MTWIMVDVEANGPCPPYSMVSLGAIAVEPALNKTFYAEFEPISDKFIPKALEVCGVTFEETLKYARPEVGMNQFASWLSQFKDQPRFISDNNGFDWQFVNYYFWNFYGSNPFGHSSTNLGSLYKGMVNNMRKNFKHLRKTKHTHNPVDDARGNAEVFLTLIDKGLVL